MNKSVDNNPLQQFEVKKSLAASQTGIAPDSEKL